ncbi:ABC transporter substrate-binding protein [Apilactobacillus ozensis]|uniref:ABC transporter substrate-binding protein n=1 Tax=Apilactobacillus ozensis TaxID=866801 RepID=UPI000A6A0524
MPTATSRLDLNQNKIKAFKNLDIRKAISLAIDRNALTKDILQDGSKPSKGFVPAGMGKNPKNNTSFDNESYVKNTSEYNLKLAKTLLQKGYKNTGTNTLKFNILTSDTDSSKSTVEYLQSALQKLPGVSVSITSVPFVQLITRQNSGDYEATTKSWQSVFADPINYLDVYESNSSYNHSGWKNKTFDKLLVDAENKYGNQPEKRWNNLIKAEQILMNEQGTIPLYQVAKPQLLRANVKDVVYNPAGVPYDWKNAYISK